MSDAPALTPGVGWQLNPQGQWDPKDIPDAVLSSATFSGYLTIDGYRASVFETPDGGQWAQKSVGTPATASSDVFQPTPDRRIAMGPKQTSDFLRKIASKIEASTNPDKIKVVADLKWVLANMDAPPPAPTGQGDQVALPASSGGKQMLTKMLEDAKKALESGDEAGFKGMLEKLQKHS